MSYLVRQQEDFDTLMCYFQCTVKGFFKSTPVNQNLRSRLNCGNVPLYALNMLTISVLALQLQICGQQMSSVGKPGEGSCQRLSIPSVKAANDSRLMFWTEVLCYTC